jgi:hypothetical protein
MPEGRPRPGVAGGGPKSTATGKGSRGRLGPAFVGGLTPGIAVTIILQPISCRRTTMSVTRDEKREGEIPEAATRGVARLMLLSPMATESG